MPVKKLQGQSGDATELKQRGLSFAFRVGLAVAKKSPYPYFHFDLHAGNGYNDDADCIGSPLAFLSEVRRVDYSNYFAGFCDRDGDQVRKLLARPELDHAKCKLFHGDNAEFLKMIPGIISHHKERLHFATGSVLSDPNGTLVPINELAWLAEVCPRLDVILHWNSTIVKRLRGGIKPDQLSLTDAINCIKKDHWLIREPAGIHQFTMLIGRNFRSGDWRAMGFHHLDTPIGQSILERCSLPKHEIERLQMAAQGALF